MQARLAVAFGFLRISLLLGKLEAIFGTVFKKSFNYFENPIDEAQIDAEGRQKERHMYSQN